MSFKIIPPGKDPLGIAGKWWDRVPKVEPVTVPTIGAGTITDHGEHIHIEIPASVGAKGRE